MTLGAEYEGAARLDDADEDERTAGFHAQARETAGHGLAARRSQRACRTPTATRASQWTQICD